MMASTVKSAVRGFNTHRCSDTLLFPMPYAICFSVIEVNEEAVWVFSLILSLNSSELREVGLYTGWSYTGFAANIVECGHGRVRLDCVDADTPVKSNWIFPWSSVSFTKRKNFRNFLIASLRGENPSKKESTFIRKNLLL